MPLAALAAARIFRCGAAAALLFVGSSGIAALWRMRHESITGVWYVDYLGPANCATIPATKVTAGFAGFLRCLSFLVPVDPKLVFAISIVCSALSVGFLVVSLWRYQERSDSPWPPYTFLIWGVLLSTDAVLTYIGASDAQHNIALLAFGLGLWWHGETIAEAAAGRTGAISWRPFIGLFLCSAFVGLTRMELLIAPIAIPLLLPRPRSAARAGRQALTWAAVGLGLLLAWSTVSYRQPLSWIALYHPGGWDFLRQLYTQSPFRADLPPLLGLPCAGAGFLVFLLCAARRDRRILLWTALAYLLLILPKILGGFGQTRIMCCDDIQRYNIILVPVALLMAAAGLAYALSWLLGGARGRLAAGALASALLMIAATRTFGNRREARPWPHQAEFAFLTEHLPAIPPGGTVVSVWLRSLHGRDADTQLAIPHALLVYARPDIRWLVVRPGDALPASRPFLFYKGATCSMDADRGVTNGPDYAEDRKALRDSLALCLRLEQAASRWEARQLVPVQEETVHLKDSSLDLGLGWVEDAAPPQRVRKVLTRLRPGRTRP